MNLKRTFGLAIFAASLLTAVGCGGGGGGTTPPVSSNTPPGGGGGPTSTPTPSPTSSSSVAPTNVAGTVVQIPSDAFGPATIAGVTYQSADIAQTTPLSGATVIVGPVPIVGATAPATLPTGDVSATTNASGAFSASVSVAAAAPSTSEPFGVPPNSLSGFTPPARGYYVEVFGAGADGKTAGTLLPFHRFVAAGTSIALHVSTISASEAAALVTVNSDRTTNGAGAVIFDESAEEVARLHASDMALQQYACHYDLHNAGPASRYLSLAGLGITGENIGGSGGTTTAAQGFAQVEADFMAEKTQSPQGGHYLNLVDTSKLWIGLGAVTNPAWIGTGQQGDYDVDYELVTPSAQGNYGGITGYPVTGGCPAGTTSNNS